MTFNMVGPTKSTESSQEQIEYPARNSCSSFTAYPICLSPTDTYFGRRWAPPMQMNTVRHPSGPLVRISRWIRRSGEEQPHWVMIRLAFTLDLNGTSSWAKSKLCMESILTLQKFWPFVTLSYLFLSSP